MWEFLCSPLRNNPGIRPRIYVAPMTRKPTSTGTPPVCRGSSTCSAIVPSCTPPPTTSESSTPPTSLPMTCSTDPTRRAAAHSSRHRSLALPWHQLEACPGNSTWRSLASSAGRKHAGPARSAAPASASIAIERARVRSAGCCSEPTSAACHRATGRVRGSSGR